MREQMFFVTCHESRIIWHALAFRDLENGFASFGDQTWKAKRRVKDIRGNTGPDVAESLAGPAD